MINEKGFTLKSVVFFIVFLIIILIVVFAIQNRRNYNSSLEIVTSFYNQYFQGNINHNYLSKDFQRRLENNELSNNEIFLCMDHNNLEIIETIHHNNYFTMKTNMPNHKFEVYFINENGWKIDAIACINKNETLINKDSVVVNTEEEIKIEETAETSSFTDKELLILERVKKDLSLRLNKNSSEMNAVSIESVLFSDSSLGTSKPGEVYSQVLTSGYIVVISIENILYQYHLDENRMFLISN